MRQGELQCITLKHSAFLTNINIGLRLRQGLKISFKIYNLFNRNYAYPSDGPLIDQMAAITQDGRNYLFSLNYKF